MATQWNETANQEWVETEGEWDDTITAGSGDVFIKNLTEEICKSIGSLTAHQLGGVLIGG